MADPYSVLGIPPESDDETIRRRYLQLVRENPPEKNPTRFSEIREAYEQLKDLETRLRYRVFEVGRNETIEAIIEDVQCQTPRRRLTLKELLDETTLP